MKLLFIGIGLIASIGLSISATCDDYVEALSEHDVYLAFRKDHAISLLEDNTTTAQSFVEEMNSLETGGEKYACGLTRFWIDQIYLGAETLYEELRQSMSGYGLEAGFYDVTDDDQVTEMFEKYADLKENYVLFRFQTYGVADHVWTVVQKPGPMYKIFQSYNMAYSVHAWTAKNLDGLFSKDPPGHIRYWDEVYDVLKAYIENAGGQVFENGTIVYPPEVTEPMKKWADYVVNYNQSLIEGNFKMAWDRFGKNEWINDELFMKEYVPVLQTVMQKVKSLIGTDTPWDQKTHDDWIGLFASPNPVCFPEVPFNTLTGSMPIQKLELQARVEVVDMDKNNCYENYKLIGQTIEDWVDEFVPKPDSATSVVSNVSLIISSALALLYQKL